MRTLFILVLTFCINISLSAQNWHDYRLSRDELQGKIAFPSEVREHVSVEKEGKIYAYTCVDGNDNFSLVVKVAKSDFSAETAKKVFRAEASGINTFTNINNFEDSPAYDGVYNGGRTRLLVVVVKNVLYKVKYTARGSYSHTKANYFFSSFTIKNIP